MTGTPPGPGDGRVVRAGRAPGTVIRCGLTDLLMADLSVSVVFFFERTLDDARLAAGLSHGLDRVPVFGGRLRPRGDALEIVCDDAGVPMTVCDVEESLGEAIGGLRMPGPRFVDHVDAPAARQGGRPLLTVRVSRLAGGGTALGCSWHHAIGDMQTFLLLMRAWSAYAEGTAAPRALLVEDVDAYLDSLLPPEDCGRPGFRLLDAAEAASRDRELETALRGTRSVQAYFSEEEAGRMRREFSAAAGRTLSMNDVLCAHVVTTIRRLDEDPQARHLAMPVNLRRHLRIPPTLAGNLIGEVYLPCAPHGEPEALAAQIRAAVADFARAHLSLRAGHAFLEAIGPARLRDCVPIGFDLSRRTFTFTNWSRFGLYDVTFEGSRPTLFSPALNLQIPWNALLVEGFGGCGFFLTAAVPARLAGRLRTADGRAALHRFREPADVLPALAGQVRNLI